MSSLKRLLMLLALALFATGVISACGTEDPPPAPVSPTPTPVDAAPIDPSDPDPAPVPDPTVAPPLDDVSFEGRTITIVVGFAPGGGHDLNSRLLAAVLPKYLPGSPRIVVQNLPGAGGARGVEEAMRRAPDGLTVSHVAVRFYKRPLFGDTIPGFNPLTVPIIGAPTFGGSGTGFYARRAVATSWAEAEAREEPLLAGTTSPGSTANLGNEFVELVGGPVRMLYGYGGSSEVMAALDRGELDATGHATQETVRRLFPEWIPDRFVVPMFWWGEMTELDRQFHEDLEVEQPLDIKDVVTATDMEWRVFDNTFMMNGMSRTYVLPEGVPDNIHQAWVEAFAAVFDDADYLELFVTATDGERPTYGSPEQIRAVLEDASRMTPEELELFRQLAGDS